ncbi:MAG: MBOAT family O-acyltransferase [Ignavibacteria bacterium]
MVFASLEFLTLFLPVFLGLYAATPRKYRNALLLLGNWLFYAWWTPKFLALIVALTALAWAGALWLDRLDSEAAKTRLMAALAVVNVACLAWYKYSNIVVASLNSALSADATPGISWERVVLPIGLSFTVLHAICYIVDVRRGTVRAERSFVSFGAYFAMFPHLIAGPIVRYAAIREELRERRFALEDFARGARQFMVGFAMKVLIADTLAPLVKLVFALERPSLVDAWIGCGAYTLQIFFDFAGYSAMAIGLARMLGFRFEPNFDNPYLAGSIREFWRRWHMTLSAWLRDYLYVPLGGSREGRWRTYRNLLLTMAIGGLWHGGDSWNYLIWGLIHGAALSCNRAFSRSGLTLPKAASHGFTLLVVMFAWSVFRAENLTAALGMWAGQLGLHGIGMGDAVALALRPTMIAACAAGIVCVVHPASPWARWQPVSAAARMWTAVWPALAFLYAAAVLAGQKTIPFLYYQF